MAEQLPLIHKIIVVIIDVISLWLGLWIYSNNPKSKVNQSFALMAVLFFFWITFGYLASVAFPASGLSFMGLNLAVIFGKINTAAVCLFFIPFYFFSTYYPVEGEKKHKLLDKFIVVFWSILAALSLFTNLVLVDIDKEGLITYGDAVGQIFLLGTMIAAIYAIALVFKKSKKLQGVERTSASYLLAGLLIWFAFNVVFNVFGLDIFGTMKYYAFGDYSAIFLLGIVFYSIIKQRLFGVKVVLTYAVIALITTLLAVDLFVFTTTPALEVMKFITLIIFLYFGRALIKSVLQEIELREQLQDLNTNLQEKVDEQTKEVKKSYEVEKKARVELQVLDKSKSEFILTTQHHLRTPLTIIKGYIQWLLNKQPVGSTVTEEARDYLQKAETASDRLMSLVNQFLDISQMEAGKSILKLQLASIEPLIKDTVDELKPDIERMHITVSYPQDKDSYPNIFIDPDKFKEALIILIDNAIKYNKENGSIAITTKTTVHPIERDKHLYQITVENTGMGIKSDELSKLFTHYFERSEEAKKLYATGRGLGLNIAKSIVNAHNGTVRAESEGEGKGARFIIELPVEG
jgi:signal transduction histidine kinase